MLRVEPVRRMPGTAVHENSVAGLCQQQQGENKPWMLVALSRVARPVQIRPQPVWRCMHTLTTGLDKPGNFLRRFFLYPQQHQKGTQLQGLRFATQNHAEGLERFVTFQGAAASLAFAQNAHESCKRMFSAVHDR